MSAAIESGFSSVWERTLQPDQSDLPPDVARFFLRLEFSGDDRQRMNSLAAKSRAGSLAPEEADELNQFMQMGWFLDLMKSKARRSLKRPIPEG